MYEEGFCRVYTGANDLTFVLARYLGVAWNCSGKLTIKPGIQLCRTEHWTERDAERHGETDGQADTGAAQWETGMACGIKTDEALVQNAAEPRTTHPRARIALRC